MPEPVPKHDPERLQRLLRALHEDFNELRRRGRPIIISLVHRATNAEAEGATGYPSRIGGSRVAFLAAGYREARQNVGPDGQPRFIDPPVVDADGAPIIDPKSGKGIDLTMPAIRSVELSGEIDAVARLRSLAERGGRLAVACRDKTLRLLAGWRFGGPEELWWALVFELAWSGQHPLLSATRHLWQVSGKGGLDTFPYDLTQVRQLAAFPLGELGKVIPENWLKRLPDAYLSEIDDAASACADLTAVLADELESALSADSAPAAPEATEPTHSPDFTSVDWFGTRYIFAKGNQAQSVRVLWDAWASGGHSLSQETIGNLIRSASGRFELSKVFRRRAAGGGYEPHPAWGTMIRPDSKGSYRLVPPESA